MASICNPPLRMTMCDKDLLFLNVGLKSCGK